MTCDLGAWDFGSGTGGCFFGLVWIKVSRLFRSDRPSPSMLGVVFCLYCLTGPPVRESNLTVKGRRVQNNGTRTGSFTSSKGCGASGDSAPFTTSACLFLGIDETLLTDDQTQTLNNKDFHLWILCQLLTFHYMSLHKIITHAL